MADESAGKTGWRRVLHDRFTVEERCVDARARRKLYVVSAALVIAGGGVFLLALMGVLERDGLASADESARRWLLATRSEPVTDVMIILAVIFGPVALPIIVLAVTAIWGLLARQAWRPVLLAAAMLTGVGLAQVIGRAVERTRPPVELMLFGADHTFSFPSGHVLGASNFLLVTAFLVFSRHRKPAVTAIGFVFAVFGVALAALSRLYLGYHWVSDVVASVAVSLMVLGAVIAVDTWRTVRIPGEPIAGERTKADAPAD